MKTRKMILALAAILALTALVFAGCGNRGAQAVAAQKVPAAAEKDIPAAALLPENAKAAAKNHVIVVPGGKAASETEEKAAVTGPFRTGTSIEVYHPNSNATTIYEMSDGSWMSEEGAVYYRGDDGVFRSRGNGDLYIQPPELGPTRTGYSMEVFYYNGNATTLYEMSDDSWMTDEGAVYYEGMNGVLHCTGNGPDLYVTAPELG